MNEDVIAHATVTDGKRKCHGCGEMKEGLNKCGRRAMVCYCGKECQIKGWSEKDHKAYCKVLKDPNHEVEFSDRSISEDVPEYGNQADWDWHNMASSQMMVVTHRLMIKGKLTCHPVLSLHRAERAILSVSASSHEVQTATIASSQVTSTAKAIRELITPHCPDNPSEQIPSTTAISHYSMSSLQTNSQIQRQPRSHTTDPQPEPKIVYTARADFTIKFADFSVLNELATKLSTMENVSIKRIDWHLTDATTDSIKAGTRKAAAKDAIARARDYAEVFGGMTAEEAITRTIPLSVAESAHYQLSSKPQVGFLDV
ncbi:putative SIMPL domain-containing protein [Seiridium unicorne]|uniref:SIMPL domain-containing protein n=1 Tax=Seiridium unicorne TaxID=138068 RepID=A0ABR2UY91_9PEZI